MKDDELISGCIRGSRKHFNELYEQYSGLLYAICLRYSRDTDEAKDILQDGFVKVFQMLEKFDSHKGSLAGWLKRIFINMSIDYSRKKSKILYSVSPETLGEDMAEDMDGDSEIYLPEEQIIQLLQELAPGYRIIFNLYVVEKMKHKEIAELLKISESTSKTQYSRARQIMQEKIKQFISVNRSVI